MAAPRLSQLSAGTAFSRSPSGGAPGALGAGSGSGSGASGGGGGGGGASLTPLPSVKDAAKPDATFVHYGEVEVDLDDLPPNAHVDPTTGEVVILLSEKEELQMQKDECFALFEGPGVRAGFIRKVFGLLMLQLFFTSTVVAVFVSVDAVKEFVQDTPAVFAAAWVVSIIALISLVCCDGLRREFPGNYVALAIFTVSESYLLGALSSWFDTYTVLLALGLTLLITTVLSVMVCWTKFAWSSGMAYLVAALIVFLMIGAVNLSMSNQLTTTIYGGFGALLFSAFIVYDTSTVVGGKHHKYALAPDEYVFATLNLYLDTVNLFMAFLLLLTSSNSGS